MLDIHADFETRSAINLPKTGTYVYAAHISTQVWTLNFAFGDGTVMRWSPGQPIPQKLVDAVLAGARFFGHNVNFEWCIWNAILVKRYGFPPLKIEQCYCTMAMASVMALPRDLAGVAMATGVEMQKDMEGRRLMLKMMRPRSISGVGDVTDPNLKRVGPRDWINETYVDSNGYKIVVTWWGESENRERLGAYCDQDVKTERAVEAQMLPLTDNERELWLLDHKINTRGVYVDLTSVAVAEAVIEIAMEGLNARMSIATGGYVNKCSEAQKLAEWLFSRGVKNEGVAKDVVLELLARKDLPVDVAAALQLRQEGSKSSTAKLKAMRIGASRDGRMRGLFQHHAANTGRWSGARAQPQNLPRPEIEFDEILQIIALMESAA